MQIRLRRVLSPEELVEEQCGICGVPFRVESVAAEVTSGEASERGVEMGHGCPECIRYLGERNPERFPSIEEYRAAVECHTSPMFGSVDEVIGVEEAGTYAEVFASSWVN